MSISGTINAMSETAGYTYDNVGRLATSNQTTNAVNAQRRFLYDRFGNRIEMWGALTGGNQIQSATIEQSGGAETNRIQTLRSASTNAASSANGATASASSSYSGSYPASAAINSDRKGVSWANGGGWADSTPSSYPDSIQVNFSSTKTINEIDVFTLQDNYTNPVEPTQSQTFSQYGIRDFAVQYWDGANWQTVSGGSVTANNKVWRKFNFASVTTDKIRVQITGTADGYSRVVEVEAYSAMVYDAAGNVTSDGARTYQYDAENRVVAVDEGATATYSYDHKNRRVKKEAAGTVTHYVWAGDQVIAEHNGATGAQIVRYIYAGSRMVAKVEGANTRYFISDRLSARLVLDVYGNVVGKQSHLPFGEEIGGSGEQQKQHFTSYERDAETGTDYAINRGYSPAVGRFQQETIRTT